MTLAGKVEKQLGYCKSCRQDKNIYLLLSESRIISLSAVIQHRSSGSQTRYSCHIKENQFVRKKRRIQKMRRGAKRKLSQYFLSLSRSCFKDMARYLIAVRALRCA
jgi:hypothetical protein